MQSTLEEAGSRKACGARSLEAQGRMVRRSIIWRKSTPWRSVYAKWSGLRANAA
jgi:hypothetical protein